MATPPPPPPSDSSDFLPSWDDAPAPGGPAGIPTAIPVAMPVGPDDNIPMAIPVGMPAPAEAAYVPELEPDILAPEHAAPPPAPTSMTCPACASPNPIGQPFCGDCGYYFSDAEIAAATAPPGVPPAASGPAETDARLVPQKIAVGNGYAKLELLGERLGVKRWRGRNQNTSTPVTLVEQALPAPAAPAAPLSESSDEIMPSFDEPGFPPTAVIRGAPQWPSVAWERKLLQTLDHPGLPREVDYFCDETHEYLVLEIPVGTSLWDAYDDPDADAEKRFGLLADLAELMQALHRCGAMVEGLRPDVVCIDAEGRVRLTDLADLLPTPLPLGTSVRGTLYSAPELLSTQEPADARAALYSFGAMLYALETRRELNEKTDFDGPGKPKPYIPRFPDCHPLMGRLMMKTFRREIDARFPSDEARKEDATGFSELIRTLRTMARCMDDARLEVASWTSTGIVRTGNEDAFAVLHAAESRQDDLGEAVLVVLCDGMGGYEAGEIAAAMTISAVRAALSAVRPFSVAAGVSPFLAEPSAAAPKGGGFDTGPVDVGEVKAAIKAALKEANRQVFTASRAPGSKRRGMGCTCEVVYIDGRNVIVGHVGDSRTYHLHEGNLVQLTRDQTLVNRLVELGKLSAAEAETHPRRNELQQAVGGQPDVDPGMYHGRIKAGDWVVVCSDGLTNHVTSKDLEQMLGAEAGSAQTAARRLVNLTLIEGATDNVTVVAVRAT